MPESPAVTPRSAATYADTELLRVARTQLVPPAPEPVAAPVPSIGERIRALIARLGTRAEA